jgi:transcription antitermination factor NusG
MFTKEKQLSKWFARTARWFVLFVRSGAEQSVVSTLSESLDGDKYAVFTPMRDYVFHKLGVDKVRKVVMFAGYVFVATTEDVGKLFATVKPIINGDKQIYKLLANGEPESVSDDDKEILTALLNEAFVIPAVEVIEVGDRVSVYDERLALHNVKVVAVDKHHGTVTIEFELLGRTVRETVAMRWVESNKTKSD